MKFDIITIFPEVFHSYLNSSILGRAQEKGLVSYAIHNLRDFTEDRHKTVDDTPYGGGAGMVMKIEPIARAVRALRLKEGSSRTILLSAKGKIFKQGQSARLMSYDQIILVCGRYEGVDERLMKTVIDEELSIGEYVLTGGELPAMILCDALTRLIPGVLGNEASLQDESYGTRFQSSYPQYTRPESFEDHRVPDVLLRGNHAEIQKWREENAKNK